MFYRDNNSKESAINSVKEISDAFPNWNVLAWYEKGWNAGWKAVVRSPDNQFEMRVSKDTSGRKRFSIQMCQDSLGKSVPFGIIEFGYTPLSCIQNYLDECSRRIDRIQKYSQNLVEQVGTID